MQRILLMAYNECRIFFHHVFKTCHQQVSTVFLHSFRCLFPSKRNWWAVKQKALWQLKFPMYIVLCLSTLLSYKQVEIAEQTILNNTEQWSLIFRKNVSIHQTLTYVHLPAYVQNKFISFPDGAKIAWMFIVVIQRVSLSILRSCFDAFTSSLFWGFPCEGYFTLERTLLLIQQTSETWILLCFWWHG